MRDLPVLSTVARRINQAVPPTQARPHQSTPGGTFTLEYCVVNAVNNTVGTVGNLLPNTCSITIKGSTQIGVPWIGAPPIVGLQYLAAVQPPLTYVIGSSSATSPTAWITVGSGATWTAGGNTLTAPAFNTGWSSFGTGFNPVSFRRVGDMLQLRGVATSSGANSIMFTLPVGYRPAGQYEQIILQTAGSTVAALAVTTAGVVENSAALASSYFLDGVSLSLV